METVTEQIINGLKMQKMKLNYPNYRHAIILDCQINYSRKIGRFVMANAVCSRQYRSNSTDYLLIAAKRDHELGLGSWYAIFDTQSVTVTQVGTY